MASTAWNIRSMEIIWLDGSEIVPPDGCSSDPVNEKRVGSIELKVRYLRDTFAIEIRPTKYKQFTSYNSC